MAHFTLVLALESAAKLEPFMDYVAHYEGEEDNNEKIFTAVFLSKLSADDRKRCSQHLQVADDGEPAFTHRDLGDADLVYRQKGTYVDYAYVWSGGVLISAVDVGGGSALQAISPALHSVVDNLANASRFKPKGSDTSLVFDGRGFGEGISASFTIRVADEVVADLAIGMPPGSSDSMMEIVQAWPDVQKTPSLVGDFGHALQEVAGLVLGGTEAAMQEGKLVFHTKLQTALLSGALTDAAK